MNATLTALTNMQSSTRTTSGQHKSGCRLWVFKYLVCIRRISGVQRPRTFAPFAPTSRHFALHLAFEAFGLVSASNIDGLERLMVRCQQAITSCANGSLRSSARACVKCVLYSLVMCCTAQDQNDTDTLQI